ncbi:hypothetical protein LCGC14_3161960 [marine sediment metagenome]|uniref:Uncharacterized protein n=1 Tax=marine sediment metagenome TaxID=412755 RepID=A0A0F8YFD4_9ZZZZ
MKTGMELVEEWRQVGAKVDFLEDYTECADELQAWLREADTWVEANRYQAVKLLGEAGNPQVNADDVLRELLGTTQKPKQEGEV